MRFLRYVLILTIFLTSLLLPTTSILAQTAPEATPVVVDCMTLPEATPDVTETPSTDATEAVEATPEATVLAADVPLHFESFTSTDVNFNPTKDQPVVVLIVFSLIFQNQLNQSIDVRAPKFQLAIEGIPWGEVASTDFQMGQLLANATQGIVLQSLTFVNTTSDDQKAVLECIENERPVDLTLTGTIDTYVDDEQQTIQVEFTSPDVIIQARKTQE